jgi:hypothetical protein
MLLAISFPCSSSTIRAAVLQISQHRRKTGGILLLLVNLIPQFCVVLLHDFDRHPCQFPVRSALCSRALRLSLKRLTWHLMSRSRGLDILLSLPPSEHLLRLRHLDSVISWVVENSTPNYHLFQLIEVQSGVAVLDFARM